MSKYSFSTLFGSTLDIGKDERVTIEQVEIPRIQRDYAQGRMVKRGENKYLNDQGRRFIDSIFAHLKDGMPMEMDFIYGAINDGKFIPLDGQQRLSTLFLLYWYIGNRELEDKSKLNELLQKFSYETRATARQFCKRLSSGLKINFDKNSISEQLRDFSWYTKQYDQDPTVIGMINMLDEIHQRYHELTPPCYEHLERLTFYRLPLNRFHLTDELYIKMNARGKQLTNFENFKADLTTWMMRQGDFTKSQNYKGRSMPHYMVFSNKLDNEWTNALWKFSKKNEAAIDHLFLSLFYRWFLFEYIINSEETNRDIDKKALFSYLEAENEYADLKPFEEQLLTVERIKRVEQLMDLFAKHLNEILQLSVPSWSDEKTTSADFLLDKGITQPQRVVLYGVWLYLKNNFPDFDKEKFEQWMRVVWNIVENTDIDSWRSAIGVMRLLIELGQYSSDIYAKYPETTKARSTAADEERRKVIFIRQNPEWEKIFIKAEKHPFLRGGIGFMIQDGMEIDDFQQRTEMTNHVFDNNGVSHTYRKEHLLLRAIISQYTTFDQLKNRNYTDTDEKEHYLKKMLAGDDAAKEALYTWCSLTSEQVLIETLKEAIAKPSQMKNINSPFEVKMHEELYKEASLQTWMQAKKAIRFASQTFGSYFVSRPSAWYDWVMLDSYRDEMINALVNNFSLKQSNQIEGTKYHFCKRIELLRKVECQGKMVTFSYDFHEDGTLRVGIKESLSENDQHRETLKCLTFDESDRESGWICRKKFNYKEVTQPNKVDNFLHKIENEVFDKNNAQLIFHQIVSQLPSSTPQERNK